MIRAVCTFILAAGAISFMASIAMALPMAPEACERAKTEQLSLETAGAARDMAQGPEWARSNLPVDRLQRVARWIELQEQILFRCPRPAPPPEPKAPPLEPEAAAAPATGEKTEKIKPEQKVKPIPAAALPETGDAGEAAAKPVKPKPQAVKKPKIEDAYRSPAPHSGEDFQHPVPGSPLPASGGASLAP